MNVSFTRKFLKELSKIPSSQRIKIEKFVFENLPSLQNVSDSGKIEKLHGFDTYYKIRFGDYRVGLRIENENIAVERVLHRKEIYRYFP